MKKKYIDCQSYDWIIENRQIQEYVELPYPGYVSLVILDKIEYEIPVDYGDSDKTLFVNGSKCVTYLPLEKNWCLSTVFDPNDNIIEWYFDMTKKNGVENGRPFFLDLYLDIAVSEDYKSYILDEDELTEAYDNKIITLQDVSLAHQTCESLLKNEIEDKAFMEGFFYDALSRLSKGL